MLDQWIPSETGFPVLSEIQTPWKIHRIRIHLSCLSNRFQLFLIPIPTQILSQFYIVIHPRSIRIKISTSTSLALLNSLIPFTFTSQIPFSSIPDWVSHNDYMRTRVSRMIHFEVSEPESFTFPIHHHHQIHTRL